MLNKQQNLVGWFWPSMPAWGNLLANRCDCVYVGDSCRKRKDIFYVFYLRANFTRVIHKGGGVGNPSHSSHSQPTNPTVPHHPPLFPSLTSHSLTILGAALSFTSHSLFFFFFFYLLFFLLFLY